MDEKSSKVHVDPVLDKWKLVPEYFKVGGLAKQHIESFNYFVDIEIKKIVEHNSYVVSSVDRSFYVKYEDIWVGMPQLEEAIGICVKSDPYMCRISDQTYSAPIFINIEYIRNSQRVRRTDILIGRMPIMLKSSHCVLAGKSEDELMKLMECPLDPGGYFLISGTEKVILIQEQLAYNQILIDKDNKDDFFAQVRSISNEHKTRCSVVSRRAKYYITHNILRDKVPIIVLFKAMGILSDNAIINLISNDNQMVQKLLPSFVEFQELEIKTHEQALVYLGKHVNIKSTGQHSYGKSRSAVDDARYFLSLLLFTHIPQEKPDNFMSKAWFLGNMMRRLMQAELNPKMKDDLDHLGNKRLHMAGNLLSLLFEDAFKRFNQELKMIADRLIPKIKANPFDIVNHIRPDLITNVMVYAIQTGNWTIRRFRMQRHGVTQVLSRLSFVSALGMMTRVNSQFERTQKISGPRSLHLSQWGMMCPCDTPEGESCGLIKNLAFMTHVTTSVDDTKVMEFIRRLGLPDLGVASVSTNLYAEGSYIVFVNGRIIGSTVYWKYLIKSVRVLRQKGLLPPLISIFANHILKSIFVCTDGGRLCRPYIRVENCRPMVTNDMIADLCRKKTDFYEMVKQGHIEFLDVNEEGDSNIAVRESDIKKNTTHLEIALFTTLGVCAGIIPYAHHNQSPRNTYQCAMGKQAMGIFGYNQFKRLDTVMHSLVYTQKPVVKTKPLDCIHFNELPGGQNSIVAVMSYSGYDIEDAIVINKAALDRGFGRCQVFHTETCSLKKYPNRTCDRIMGPAVDTINNQTLYKHRILGSDGLPTVGSLARFGHVLVNKSSPVVSSSELGNDYPSYMDVPMVYKTYEPSYVDRVMVTTASDTYLKIKTLLRQTRTPEVGDKFSSRHGQKGVIGFIAKHEDMPFTEEGIVPDIIMNPHGFPSRMTVGKLIELISGKASCVTGNLHDATAFEDCKLREIHQELMDHGFNYGGKDFLYSGITGEPLVSYIYFGPVYYQKLKHMVQDKVHARARGPRVVLTRQPTEGRAREGGLRVGEMERDCLICYGASFLINERLMLSSDVLNVEVCSRCGLLSYNKWCKYCNSNQTLYHMKIPYSCKLLLQELASMNVVPRIQLENTLS